MTCTTNEGAIGQKLCSQMCGQDTTPNRDARYFNPCKVSKGPSAINSIVGTRVMVGKYGDGRSFFHIDDWRDTTAARQQMDGR